MGANYLGKKQSQWGIKWEWNKLLKPALLQEQVSPKPDSDSRTLSIPRPRVQPRLSPSLLIF